MPLDRASRAIAMLAGVGETLPNPHLLIRPFARREAVLSSRIEGTQTSLAQLVLFEASGGRADPAGDGLEVANHVRASELGLELLHTLPLSVRLFNTVHHELMSGVRGQDRMPGELRREQVWIGGDGTGIDDARYVPPPPARVRDLLTDLEGFLNGDFEIPPLIQCALVHYQFEAIHPYLDGNGRMGRLLIVLYLYQQRVLTTPLLYLSAYFERHRAEYYDRLLNVSARGDWDGWLKFFLLGIEEQSRDALSRARRIRDLRERYRERLQESRASANALRLLDLFFEQPAMTPALASERLASTWAGAKGVLERLRSAGIVELAATRSPLIYVARELVESLDGNA
jgi:Fic family protein